MLINRLFVTGCTKFGYARVDADFPDGLVKYSTRPERVSDHDAPSCSSILMSQRLKARNRKYQRDL